MVERPVMGVGRLRRPAQLTGSGRTVERLRSRQLEVSAVWVLCHASSCFRLMVVELPLPRLAMPRLALPSPFRARVEPAPGGAEVCFSLSWDILRLLRSQGPNPC